jgi:hypothetical protein
LADLPNAEADSGCFYFCFVFASLFNQFSNLPLPKANSQQPTANSQKIGKTRIEFYRFFNISMYCSAIG